MRSIDLFLVTLPILGAFACGASSAVMSDKNVDDNDILDTDDGEDTDDTDDTDDPDQDFDADGFTPNEGDCDDDDPDSNPDGDEGDGADGVDQDCDGVADDRTVCEGDLADYQTIQDGIDDAPEGFVLVVCPGTYDEDLSISERDISLLAAEGPEVTIISGSGQGPVVTLGSVEVGIEGFTIQGGISVDGGGIYGMRSTVTLTGNHIKGNTVSNLGGGVYLQRAEGSFTENKVSSNVAAFGGGVVIYEGNVEVDSNEIYENTATTTDEETWGTGGGGGGVLIYGNSALRNNHIHTNTSYYNGGGVYILYGSGDITGNTVEANYAYEDGGGVYTTRASGELSGNTILENVAADDAGGVRVYVGSMNVTENDFIGNVASDDAGGMKLSHSANTITNNHFESNQTGDAGGGLELDNETSNVTGCTFQGNTAARGAGMHSWRNEGRVTLSELYFDSNVASDCGGAMQFDNDPYVVTVEHVEAYNNDAVDGAVICIDFKYQDDEMTYWEESVLDVRNSLFADNDATDDGGAIYVLEGDATFTNVTFHNNDAPSGALAAVKENGSLALVNSIVARHGGTYLAVSEDGGTATWSYSAWYSNDGTFSGLDEPTSAAGNIDDDCDLADPDNGDASLGSSSACIDAGDPSISDSDGTRSDIGMTGGPGAR